ncbi:MAG: DUF4856 domain-containing protein [Pontibacterium sp.]
MKLNKLALSVALAAAVASTGANAAKIYADYPVTVKGYEGSAETSVAYTGQAARQVLHTSLKKLSGKGTGDANPELKAQMLAYFSGTEAGRDIISPASKAGFPVKQTKVDELSKGKNLAGKTYKGAVPAWPGNLTGPEVIEFMIDKAAASEKGYDPVNGLDYIQLISKFAMGAVFYNQAVDNYLDEKLEANTKPNDKAYGEGKPYTGKEHVWDEAFGYFGAPAHALSLTPKQAYNIAKAKPEAFALADANKDGVVSLYDETVYAHAYYAAGADKSGKTNYFHTITNAFIDGRQLITNADGKKLTDAQRTELKGYAAVIAENWEKVIAEAAFKYAGSVYKDIEKLNKTLDESGDINDIYRKYAKHWGELKGFAMALQVSGKDIGSTATELNRLIGFSPVLLGNTQVVAVDANGKYVQAASVSLDEYMLNMAKVQQVLVDKFAIKARSNDVLGNIDALVKVLGEQAAEAEND